MGKHIDLDGSDETEEQLEDRIPISVRLDLDVHQCDCCGKAPIKRTIEISIEGACLHLGVICAGKWFGVNLTGNPWYAAERLSTILNYMDNKELEDKIEEIKEASQEW